MIKRGTWKVVCQSEVPDDANIRGGRFVLAIKNPDTDEEIYKARFVVQGHKDKEKDFLIHDSPTISTAYIRILIAIAGIFGFRIWSTDIIQAYLQSSAPLMRDIFIKAGKELCLDKDKLLKLLRPLYGLAESGDFWYRTITNHLREDLKMKSQIGDLSLFTKHVQNQLLCLLYTSDAADD